MSWVFLSFTFAPLASFRGKSKMKLFYTGPLVNAELLVLMLENHGIPATQEFASATVPEGEAADDLSRLTKILVAEADYDRAHRLIYTEREDEL